MNKTLSVKKYAFGKTILHAYDTKDFLADSVFLLEKDKNMIIVEQPSFKKSAAELTEYIGSLDVNVEAKLLSYHMAGAKFLPEVPVYATKEAGYHGHKGKGKELVDKFSDEFSDFDNNISKVMHLIRDGAVNIAGFELNIIKTREAYDIEFPEINCLYTHMLGADTHSIVAGAQHADMLIEQLEGYKEKKYKYILSSHHMPEGQEEVKIKTDYIKDIKKTAQTSSNAQEFKQSIKEKYTSYYGENYLDMTAGFFFPEK